MRILTISLFSLSLFTLTGCFGTQSDGTFEMPSDCDTGDTGEDCEDISDDDQDDDTDDTGNGGSDDDDQDDDTDDTGNGNGGSGNNGNGGSGNEFDFELDFDSPGFAVYGSAWCHIEYVDNLQSRLDNEDWGGWEYTISGNWVDSMSIRSNPGLIEGVRANCTWCPDQLSSEPSGSQAENLGCTWSAYGTTESQSYLNGAISAVYFGDSYEVDTVVVYGGSSVLVDLRD